MGSRIRRCVITADGAAATGARDFSDEDNSEFNRDKGDKEMSGDEVQMTVGPYPVKFDLLAPSSAINSGYVGVLVVVPDIVTRSTPTAETVTQKTYTYTQGHLLVSLDAKTDGSGRIPVKGEFKTRTIV